MNTLSSLNRKTLLKELSAEHYELLIIGGGITGAGIALDAASRGLKTALVEKNDFASGTSSRSTKLIHGGLRYLKQFEIALVREVGRERAIVHELAPHLVVPEKMLLPLIEGGTFGKYATSFGLMVYDVLAGVEKPDQRIMLTKEEALEKEPLLQEEGLQGGGYYAEYRTDDARLTIEVIKTATKFDAKCINYVEGEEFLYENGQVLGVKCRDVLKNQAFIITADTVVSAAGPWVDKIRKKDNSLNNKRLHLTKGVHIVVSHERFPVRQSLYFDVSDGRMIFAIPRGRVTYIGTTDTDYHGDLNHVLTKMPDVEYLLAAVNDAFPSVDLKIEDVESSWAGLRPLIHEEGKSASELSRKDEIFQSPNGLISIAGGKLTGYRKMAERIVDLVVKKRYNRFGEKIASCHTADIDLCGGEFKNYKKVKKRIAKIAEQCVLRGLTAQDAGYLVHNYGTQTHIILKKMTEFTPTESPALALLKAELWFAVEYEMVQHPLDFFMRRTGRFYFNIHSVRQFLAPILQDFKNYFGWNEQQLATAIQEVERALEEASCFE